MGLFIGIDLGTTYSVASYKDGKFVFIKDETGRCLIPSVVCCVDGFYVGHDAVEKEEDYPQFTIRSSKRSIGQNIEFFEDITPTVIATYILKYIKKITEIQTGEEIEGLVITVPAYFNQNQRFETKKAAEEAGFNVLRIINEPTAAALAYGEDSKVNELVLIYDLGGGTFDTTLLHLTDDNIYQVLSTSGNTKLGGDDFDNLIVGTFKKTIPSNMVPFKDFEVRLKKFAEEIKIQLNYKTQVTKTLKYCGVVNGKIHHHEFSITAEKYKDLISSLLFNTKSHVLNVLNDADKKISALSKIILVGGSTKSKFVRDFVKDNFNTKVYFDIDPDLTVAAGAAELANSLKEKSANSSVLIDVTPLSLGIETKGGLLNKVIPRNATIPVTSSQEYITSEDNQDTVVIKIYQGERPLAKDNEFLGEFELSGFEKRSKGQTKIIVKFDIDSSGLVVVTAFDKISGIQSEVVLKSLTSDKINALMDDLEMITQDDKALVEKVELERLQSTARTLMFSATVAGSDKNELEEIYESVKDSIISISVFIQSFNEQRV